MQLVQNEIIITFCTDGRHTFLFCFDGMRLVINAKQLFYAIIDGIIIQLF